MNTQLAAWAQLRHDNLLYAKQSYTGGITCFYPFSYVEPIPEFYSAVSRFARNAAEHFEAVDGQGASFASYVAEHFRFVEEINTRLNAIALKERSRTPFSEDEKDFLKEMIREENTCGPEIDGWYPRLFYGGKERSKEPDLVVADVHTVPTDEAGNLVGWVLHAGTGPLNMAVVNVEAFGWRLPMHVFPAQWLVLLGLALAAAAIAAVLPARRLLHAGTGPLNMAVVHVEVPGEGLIAFIGPVMSYYEHVSTNFKRLTDEAWQTAYAAAPSFRPDLVNLYLADRNGASRGEGAKLATQGAAVGTAVPDAPEVPRALEMAPNYPNPFNAATIIGFTVPTAKAYERVELDVYDVQGRRIRHLLSRDLPAGNYTVRWDGLLDDGTRAASGLYFSRLRVGSQTATGTMTLVR